MWRFWTLERIFWLYRRASKDNRSYGRNCATRGYDETRQWLYWEGSGQRVIGRVRKITKIVKVEVETLLKINLVHVSSQGFHNPRKGKKKKLLLRSGMFLLFHGRFVELSINSAFNDKMCWRSFLYSCSQEFLEVLPIVMIIVVCCRLAGDWNQASNYFTSDS